MRKTEQGPICLPAGLAAAVFLLFGVGVTQAQADIQNWLRFNNKSSSGWTDPYDRSASRSYGARRAGGSPTLSSSTLESMQTAIKRYSRIATAGGWSKIPYAGRLKVGARHASVSLIRRRLAISGDMRQNYGYSGTYDYYVERAVRNFQRRHGLKPTGIVNKATVTAMNVPASGRLRQLRTNLIRVRSHSRRLAKEGRYVMVNIPAAEIEAIEGGRVVSRHAAVVGKTDRRTPLLNTKISEINFNPYWTVPKSIIRKDLVPSALRNRNVLEKFKIRAFDGKGREVNPKSIRWGSPASYNYRYRQDPWKGNSMGFVKINFWSPDGVYMHDTPSKSLFGRDYRAYSSGCIRVQNVSQFVTWLLKDNGDWSRRRVDGMKRNGERLDVKVKSKTPLHFVYVTAWAKPNGEAHFRRDLYGRDGAGRLASAY